MNEVFKFIQVFLALFGRIGPVLLLSFYGQGETLRISFDDLIEVPILDFNDDQADISAEQDEVRFPTFQIRRIPNDVI